MILSPSPPSPPSPPPPQLLFSPNPIAFSVSPIPQSITCKCLTLTSCAITTSSISALPSADVAAILTGEDLPEDYDQCLPVPDPSCRRRAGVLLHPTSLQGPHGIGDLGDEALRFLDWLHSCGCSVWQVLHFSIILSPKISTQGLCVIT